MGGKDHDSKWTHYRNLQEKNRENQLLSKAYLLCSTLALERGTPQLALTHAKHGIRLLRRAWTNATVRVHGQDISTEIECRLRTETGKLAEESLQSSTSTITIVSSAGDHQSLFGSGLWCLITPLFRSLLHLSELYAHHGMFQETMYYAEQAHKLAKQVGSDASEALAAASLGRIWLKAGALDKGAKFLMQAKSYSVSCEISRYSALLVYYLGNMHGLLGNQDAELAGYEEAELVLKSLTSPDFINKLDCIVDPVEALQEKMAGLKVSKLKASTQKATTRAKAPATRRIATRVKGTIDIVSSPVGECPRLISFKAMILRNKARLLMCIKRCADALPILHEAERYSNSQVDVVDQGLAIAKQLLLRSLEQMNSDPVYSVLQESTISFPSVVSHHSKLEKSHGERLSFAHTPHPGKAKMWRCDTDPRRSKSPSPEGFFDNLRQAQERLTEVHSIATMVAPMVSIHTISSLLNTVTMLLSATSEVGEKSLAHPGFASYFTGMCPIFGNSAWSC
jgi:separase